MEYYQFTFSSSDEPQREVLIAMLGSIGFSGFEECDSELKGFILKEDFDQDLFDSIIKENVITYYKSIVEEKNWNEEWERSFSPVLVNLPDAEEPFAAVRAAFHGSISVPYEIIVTPKMSFGTGHHATTFLVMQQMGLLDFQSKAVIDYGTGTGVLAILAEKMGAGSVIAIDNDDWSINNAIENITANDCLKTSLIKGETVETGMKADIILANINLNIILANLKNIRAACNDSAIAIFSGVLRNDKPAISSALEENGFLIKQIVEKNNWLVIVTTTS